MRRTYKQCKEEAATCKSRTEFRKKFPASYEYAVKHTWLLNIFDELRFPILHRNFK